MSSDEEVDVDSHPREVDDDKPFAVRAKKKRIKRKRSSRATREAILEAAHEVFAQDGKEGLSFTQVAHRASVDRATARQYFHTREKLIEATAAGASAKLYRAIFGDPAVAKPQSGESIGLESMIANLATFAMDNPALGRVWLFKVLSSRRPASDPFWREYLSRFQMFAKTESAQPGIDVEVSAVLLLAGSFIWPVWARAGVRDATEPAKMAERFRRAILRLYLHGTLKPEKYEDLVKKSR